jgi:hypothetical protein
MYLGAMAQIEDIVGRIILGVSFRMPVDEPRVQEMV